MLKLIKNRPESDEDADQENDFNNNKLTDVQHNQKSTAEYTKISFKILISIIGMASLLIIIILLWIYLTKFSDDPLGSVQFLFVCYLIEFVN